MFSIRVAKKIEEVKKVKKASSKKKVVEETEGAE